MGDVRWGQIADCCAGRVWSVCSVSSPTSSEVYLSDGVLAGEFLISRHTPIDYGCLMPGQFTIGMPYC